MQFAIKYISTVPAIHQRRVLKERIPGFPQNEMSRLSIQFPNYNRRILADFA